MANRQISPVDSTNNFIFTLYVSFDTVLYARILAFLTLSCLLVGFLEYIYPLGVIYLIMPTNQQYDGLTGYQLHTERLRHTGKSGIRTFKLPLKTNDQELFGNFFENIKHDHEGQIGATNITTWTEEQKSSRQIYSLLDFWLDSVRAGVVFASSSAELNELLSVCGDEDAVDEQVKTAMRAINPTFFKHLKFNDFKEEIALKEGMRSSSTKNSVTRRLYKCLDCTEEDAPEEIQQAVADLIKTFFTTDGKIISRNDQDDYWQVHFGLDKSLYKLDSDIKLTFSFLPDIPFTPEADAHMCLDKYRCWINENAEKFQLESKEDKTNFLQIHWGIEGNYNAFSNYFNQIIDLLREEEGRQKLLDALLNTSDLWEGAETELKKRFDFLVDKAKQLPKAKCVDSWSDYRTTFGGRLSSWLSNTLNQEEFIKDTVSDQKEELKQIIKNSEINLYKKAFSAADDNRAVELSHEAVIAQKTLEKLQKSSSFEPQLLGVYRDNLGRLRSLLNKAHQLLPDLNKAHQLLPDEIENKSAHEVYSALHERIRLMPKFIGGAKAARFEKYVKSLQILKQGASFLENFEEKVKEAMKSSVSVEVEEISEGYFLRQLNTLKRFYDNANDSRFKGKLSSLFDKDLGVNIEAVSNRETFYISPYSKHDNRAVISVEVANYQQLLKSWVNELKPYWGNIIATENWGEIIDAMQLERIRIGWIYKLYPKLTFAISDDLDELFAKAATYRDLHGHEVEGSLAANFLQRIILSEIEGRVKEASREKFTVRYVIQPVGSEKTTKYPLFVTSNKDKLSATERKQWYIRDINSSFSRSETDKKGWILKNGKDFSNGFQEKYISDNTDLFKIISSKYQLQFLDKALPNGAKKFGKDGDVNLKLSEHSFIAEETLQASWDFSTDTVSLKSVDKDLFVAIPVNIEPESQRSSREERTRYLGIDVGEYGLAYTLIETIPKVRVIKSGFLYEKTLRNIRKQVTNIKNSQRLGTFGVPSTKLARLRTQAITKLRNKVHDLVVRYDAIPVYEWQISNFETKSGRVTKIYNSVKRADTNSGANENADGDEAALVWGKRPYKIGQEVSARATSNMCSNCFKSIYQFTEQDFTEESRSGEYVEFKIAKNTVKGFVPNDEKITSKQKMINAVHDYARPSVDILVKRNDVGVDKEILVNFLEHRGASALYECPFCSHLSDADVQASLFIGLRAICRDQDDETTKVKISDLMDFAQKQNIDPISADFIQ